MSETVISAAPMGWMSSFLNNLNKMIKKIIDKQELHKSYLFTLNRLTIETDRGNQIERDLICHPGASIILPICDDGSIVMIRNYRYAAEQTLWELPCGTIDNNEEPLVCAIRELTEETGYTAENMEFLGQHYSCPGYNNELIYSFLATGLTPGSQELEEYEDISVEILPDETVRQMVANNEIMDSKTIAALSTYWFRGI